MNRRLFFTTMISSLFAGPIFSALRKTSPVARDELANALPSAMGAIRRSGIKRVESIPKEAGKVYSMAEFRGHLFIACENGLWTMPIDPK